MQDQALLEKLLDLREFLAEPYIHPEKFHAWLLSNGQPYQQVVKNFSEGLRHLLKETEHPTFIMAITGEDMDMSSYFGGLLQGKTGMISSFLKRHLTVKKYLEENIALLDEVAEAWFINQQSTLKLLPLIVHAIREVEKYSYMIENLRAIKKRRAENTVLVKPVQLNSEPVKKEPNIIDRVSQLSAVEKLLEYIFTSNSTIPQSALSKLKKLRKQLMDLKIQSFNQLIVDLESITEPQECDKTEEDLPSTPLIYEEYSDEPIEQTRPLLQRTTSWPPLLFDQPTFPRPKRSCSASELVMRKRQRVDEDENDAVLRHTPVN
jgi:hypothetical protein